eukprot:TRINITY_DN3974_c1_g1_i1.p2 TRINITY_DN3974_c1_g1~~TRINITY_DN3974_c1_g1_i1.p2  ORF type:complete len:102 (-),score=8.59 TRINITY_DN3974_c1_g1_i1:432-737(-)
MKLWSLRVAILYLAVSFFVYLGVYVVIDTSSVGVEEKTIKKKRKRTGENRRWLQKELFSLPKGVLAHQISFFFLVEEETKKTDRLIGSKRRNDRENEIKRR